MSEHQNQPTNDEPTVELIGFFPGLGSRASYREVGRRTLNFGLEELRRLHRIGAQVCGLGDRPEAMLFEADNLPAGRLAQQGFLGVALVVHSLALDVQLRGALAGTGFTMKAFTGESFGILTAAVAGGAMTVHDGLQVARAFTPLLLLATEGPDPVPGPGAEPIAQELAPYLSATGGVREPSHVIGLRGDPDWLAEMLSYFEREWPTTDFEVHKRYSWRQVNVYVRAGRMAEFERVVTGMPQVQAFELKAPTTFIAHSQHMGHAREALARFLDEHQVHFADPHTPIVSNHGDGLLVTAAEVRLGILAMTDQVMASRNTAESVERLRPDLVVELGRGEKSLQLLADNGLYTPTAAYTGEPAETQRLVDGIRVLAGVRARLRELRDGRPTLATSHHETLRNLFRFIVASDRHDQQLRPALSRDVADAMGQPERPDAPAFHAFIEILQHTLRHHRDIVGSELVIAARLRKRLQGNLDEIGHTYLELQVLEDTGQVTQRELPATGHPDAVVVHFEQPSRGAVAAARLLGKPLRRLEQLRVHRPALLSHAALFYSGGDRSGWLTALVASGALRGEDAAVLATAALSPAAPDVDPVSRRAALDRALAELRTADVAVIAPHGVPVQTVRDLAEATRAVLLDGMLDKTQPRRIRVGGSCLVLAITDSQPAEPGLDASPYRTHTLPVSTTDEIVRYGVNAALDVEEQRAVLAHTPERTRVLRYAQSRKVLSSTIYAYVKPDEKVIGFGQGGSESMTMFLRRPGDDSITVRKVLSDALTTVNWQPDGEGVMLAPFAKAKKQAEYLQGLPVEVRHHFPRVSDVVERNVPVPPYLRSGGTNAYHEVMYEMSFVSGDEVSRYVERHMPPPAVVARLYEQILRVLHETVHSVNRTAAPGGTLDEQYFRKIEERLNLCRQAAPRTFGPNLLDTERIVIDGVSCLNSATLLQRFRARPEFASVLEPRFHALVMGDTNTENIKISNTRSLEHAQRLIEEGAPDDDVQQALRAITADSLGIMFLDPRAIGFRGDGHDTRDDPMYDNKPWHNSIGHYDEIHFEQFRLRVRTGSGRTPRIDIHFIEGNPYQRAYRVRDVVARRGQVDTRHPRGMEDHFARVMRAVYRLDDPASPQHHHDPFWLVRFVFTMGTHFAAMPPFHFQSELDGTLTDSYSTQRRPVAIYCEGIKWLNWALEMLEGTRTHFLGLAVPELPYFAPGAGDTGRSALETGIDEWLGDDATPTDLPSHVAA